MAYKQIFIDSDILLDVILNREPHSSYAEISIALSLERKFRLKTSSLVLANIHYILSKKLGNHAAKEEIRNLMKVIGVLPFEADIVDMALSSKIIDFEGAIQNYIAERYKCDLIITRNIIDYKHAIIPVLTAEQFLRTL